MRRHTTLLASLFVAAATVPASAASILITGTPGAGVSLISFSGTARANADGSLPLVGTSTFQSGIDLQFDDYIADPTVQDMLVSVTGDLTITQGTQVAAITQLFLDEDTSSDVGNPDDLGLRSASLFNYTITGGDLVFAGSGSIALDINAFNQITAEPNSQAIDFLAATQADISVTIQATPVPLPAGLPLLGAGVAALAVARRRRG